MRFDSMTRCPWVERPEKTVACDGRVHEAGASASSNTTDSPASFINDGVFGAV